MKFLVIKDRIIDDTLMAKSGDVVYKCNKPDYGSSIDDTYITGIEHISVTLNEDGGYPFFTIPVEDIKTI